MCNHSDLKRPPTTPITCNTTIAFLPILTATCIPRADETWFARTYPEFTDKTIAYFSAEFGLHEALPIYSGGLGILSGDHCKEASDLGLPFVGVGFLYPQGYFRQSITRDGVQEASYDKLHFSEAPAVPALDPDGNEVMISVDLPGRTHLRQSLESAGWTHPSLPDGYRRST